MSYIHTSIADFEIGKVIKGAYILGPVNVKETSKGKKYVQTTIADKTGELSCMYWDAFEQGSEDVDYSLMSGKVVEATVQVGEYNGNLQTTAKNIRLLSDSEIKSMGVEMKDLIPVGDLPVDLIMKKIEGLVNSYSSPYRELCNYALEKHGAAFAEAPAAKFVHHAVYGGLAQHTYEMMMTAVVISRTLVHYQLNEEMLVTAVLFHDIMKPVEMDYSEFGVVKDYTNEGKMLGHIVMGAEFMDEACDAVGVDPGLKLVMKNLILSHHGKLEYGSPVQPATKEAWLLHEIDMMSAKLYQAYHAEQSVEVGEWSEPKFGLDRAQVYNHGYKVDKE